MWSRGGDTSIAARDGDTARFMTRTRSVADAGGWRVAASGRHRKHGPAGNAAGTTRAKINALASDNRARVLSSPRIMARNGETATIQVGQEVPIITSQ